MKNWKMILGIIGSLLGIFGAAYFAEDRWNQKAEVQAAEVMVIAVEHQTVKTLQGFQKQQNIRFEMQQQQFVNDMIMRNKIERRKDPGDQDLKEEAVELKERKQTIKKNLDKLLK